MQKMIGPVTIRLTRIKYLINKKKVEKLNLMKHLKNYQTTASKGASKPAPDADSCGRLIIIRHSPSSRGVEKSICL